MLPTVKLTTSRRNLVRTSGTGGVERTASQTIMSRTAILLDNDTDRKLKRLLPPLISHNQPVRPTTSQPPVLHPPTQAGVEHPSGQVRPRVKSPVLISPATPEILEAKRRQREKEMMALRTAIEARQKAREKKRLEEIKRTVRESLPEDKQTVLAPGASKGSAPSTVQGRPRVRSPILITPATPEIFEANKSQQEKQDRDSLRMMYKTAEEKVREKKKLDEMERNEAEDLMVPPLRFTQVQNSWLLVPPTRPPLLPLNPLKEPPPLIELPSHSNPTPSFVKVRIKRNLARYSFYVT